MKWRKVMAFSLAASMIAGQAVSAAPAAEAASESALQTQADSKSNTNASYTDPWTKTAVPNQAAKVTSDVDKTKFTHKIPLTASNSLGSCPMSTFPVEWNNVTTLSRVENIHAMNNT